MECLCPGVGVFLHHVAANRLPQSKLMQFSSLCTFQFRAALSDGNACENHLASHSSAKSASAGLGGTLRFCSSESDKLRGTGNVAAGLRTTFQAARA